VALSLPVIGGQAIHAVQDIAKHGASRQARRGRHRGRATGIAKHPCNGTSARRPRPNPGPSQPAGRCPVAARTRTTATNLDATGAAARRTHVALGRDHAYDASEGDEASWQLRPGPGDGKAGGPAAAGRMGRGERENDARRPWPHARRPADRLARRRRWEAIVSPAAAAARATAYAYPAGSRIVRGPRTLTSSELAVPCLSSIYS
jgi:hypothetical protein